MRSKCDCPNSAHSLSLNIRIDMDTSKVTKRFKDFRRQRIQVYGRGGESDTDTDADDEPTSKRARRQGVGEGGRADNEDADDDHDHFPGECEGNLIDAVAGPLSDFEWAPADVSHSESDVEEHEEHAPPHAVSTDETADDHALSEIPNDLGITIGEANEEGLLETESSSEGFVGALDFLRGRDIESVARPYVAGLRSMVDFERELVVMQTQNKMSKAACERVFSMLQKNAHMLAQQLPTWKGSFRTARRHVNACTPPCTIKVSGIEGGRQVTLGPYPAYPIKEIETRHIDVEYALYESRLVDVVAFHAHLHGTHRDDDQAWDFDIGIDGVPESNSGGVSIDVLTLKFTACRSVYTLAVLRPRRTGLKIPDSVILKSFLADYVAVLQERTIPVNRVRLRYVIADAPKRAKLLNMKSHGGYYSCQHCHIRGDRATAGVRFLPEEDTRISEPRSLQTVEADADTADRLGLESRGIKGSSPLRQIPGYDYVSGIVQERMHLCDLGLCRQLCRLLFRCKGISHQSDYSRYVVDTYLLDAVLKGVKVPTDFSRRTRDFNYSLWKSEEFRNLYLCFWPLVANVVQPTGRDVWLNFVYIMRGLLVRETGFISESRVRNWHKKFVGAFGRNASAYNVHAFSHVLKLRDLGLLTDTSAVYNENHYGEMKRRFQSGTPSVGLQGIQDCNVRNLGTHNCRRTTRISPKATSKTDDSLVFTRDHKLLKVTAVGGDGLYEGREIPCQPTNLPLADLDFTAVYTYRLLTDWQKSLGPVLPFAYDDVIGKAVIAREHVSMIPLDVLLER